MNRHSLSRTARLLALASLTAPLAASAAEFGTLQVTQLADNNNPTSHATAPGIAIVKGPGSSSGGNFLTNSNRGDYNMNFGNASDTGTGVLLNSLAQLLRNDSAVGGPATGNFVATSSLAVDTATNKYSLAIHWAEANDSVEVNYDTSYVYLPYSAFLGGVVINSANNGEMTSLTGSPGLVLGTHFTDLTTPGGQYALNFGALAANASQTGILLVTGSKNEDNFALSRANSDGTFNIFCHDSGANGASYENDGVAFAYLPASAVGTNRLAAIGRVNGDASTDVAAGSFTVTKGGTGQWFIQIPGHTQATGTLIISPEGGGSNNSDNIVNAGWDAANNRWIVESRDINGTLGQLPGLQNMANATEDAFSFAFFALGVAPTVSLDSPAAGSQSVIGTPLTLTATANDDSAVAKVEFYDGTTLLGEDTTAPYEFVWNNAPLGGHTVKARAIDDLGVSTLTGGTAVTVTPPAGTGGIYFDGMDDHVTFGDAPALKLSTFTLECWFKREPGGVPASTGSGGVSAIPLITKGRGENDSSGVNCNYFMGIEAATGKLAVDFEDLASGLNHPAVGVTAIPVGVWQHAAVSFDGGTWRLYLNGVLEAEVGTAGQVPENISIQHAGLGTAMNSTGVREGYFHGQMDEVRFWDHARSAADILAAINSEIPSSSGLIARYAMDEAAGTQILSSAGGTLTGSMVNGVFRTAGAVFDANTPPTIAASAPADEALDVPLSANLSALVADLDGDNLQVTFHGRKVGTGTGGEDFTVVALPDTQFYSENIGGNLASIFSAQTDWIVAEKDARNIGFVLHLGDITDNGDTPLAGEWDNARNALYALENPATTLLPEGVPYMVAVGNHDQTPNGDADGTTTNFNAYFGSSHFAGKSYYGGTSEPAKADNNYTLFTAGGMDFIVISLEYDTSPDAADLDWADALLKAHPDRRGIVITHHMVNTGNPATFSPLGSAIYEALKDNPNLILMHGGHIHGEGRRSDTFQGRTIHSILADYQGRTNGGDGWLRILKFRPSLNRIDIQTYSPTLDQFETDADSEFSIDVNLKGGLGAFTEIGSVTVAPGTANMTWSGLEAGQRYEWYATASDGVATVTTPVRSFITDGAVFPPSVALTSPANGTEYRSPADITLEATAGDLDGTIQKVEFYSGTTLLGEDTTEPYSLEWTGVPEGSYTVIAKATDEEGNTTSAAPVSVQVFDEPEGDQFVGLFNGNWVVAGTSPLPRNFSNPGTTTGNLALKVDGASLRFLSGITAVANWDNPGNVGISSNDNISSAYANAAGNLFVHVIDNTNNNAVGANPGTNEQSSGTAAAFLPYSAGWIGASLNANGVVLASNLPPGVSVTKGGSGLYTVNLPLEGNLLAFTNGNGGTDADNVASVRIEGGVWVVETRDNGGGLQNGSLSFVYVPVDRANVLAGKVSSTGTLSDANNYLTSLGATVTVNTGYIEITFGDGSLINPSNTALFITADSAASVEPADNLVSYSGSGNSFRVFSQDLPGINGTFEPIDFRFLAVPFVTTTPPPTPVVSIGASDASAGENGDDQALTFTVARTGATTEALTVAYSLNGTATSGADFTALTGSIVIPVGAAEAIIPVAVLTDDDAEGDETLTLTLTDAATYDLGVATVANGLIKDRPLQAYLHANGLGAAEEDTDGDGDENILEYYLGSAGDNASSRSVVTAIAAGNGSFTAQFPHSKSATDVTAAVQWSTDLTTWHASGANDGTRTGNIALQPVSPPEQDPETIEAVLTFAAGPAPEHVYLRLVVTP